MPIAQLFYDADCGFCTRSAVWLRERGAAVAVAPLQRADLAAFGIDPRRAIREVPFVASDGRVSWGAQAIGAALRACPEPWRTVGEVLAWPGVRTLAGGVYRLVARFRHRLPGGTASCRLE